MPENPWSGEMFVERTTEILNLQHMYIISQHASFKTPSIIPTFDPLSYIVLIEELVSCLRISRSL